MPDEATRTSTRQHHAPHASLETDGQFVPGAMVAGRFRIAALLGTGGMGQVYRADDLKLGLPVALKFLPRRLVNDPDALTRFHTEVKLARQISHPNVCRVFDIGEVEGQPFLSMEYIDGEDLSSLIRRIGRVPSDKAVEIARQLCAGLAVAHEAGLLHRDLKPANVMLDGRGRVRITDFGLAGVETAINHHDIGSGTPAYMAPEQLAGQAVTRRSDLYAVGLVLYELFTGKRVFEATTDRDVRTTRSHTTPTRPSHWVAELDPLVERVILRCLELDPNERPASALEIAAALPGGNPMEAALLAGETPSPEMVAAAPTEGALSPAGATTCLVAVVALLVALSIGDQVNMHQRAPLSTSPIILADRAARVITDAGYTAPPADRASGFAYDESWLLWSDDPMPAPARWSRISAGQPLTFYFWYRQSPEPLVPLAAGTPTVRVSPSDPSPSLPGMVSVVLDPRGRLVTFTAVPEARWPQDRAGVADWRPLFDSAGLDPATLVPTTPHWLPPVYADQVLAWTGHYEDHPDLPLRVEAASAGGRPVVFQILGPWETPTSRAQRLTASGSSAAVVLLVVVVATVLVGGVVMARNNLRAGRGDLSGAKTVASWVGTTVALATALGSTWPETFDGALQLQAAMLSEGLVWAAASWLLYIALEPFVRSTRPALLISWTRLLSGRVTDPMIGRDILAGGLLALTGAAAFCLSGWTKLWVQHPFEPNNAMDLTGFGSVMGSIEMLLMALNPSLVMAVLVFLAMTSRVIRNIWLSAGVLAIVATGGFILFSARSWPTMLASGVWISLGVVAVARFGLLAGVSWSVFFMLGMRSALTTDFTLWHADAVLFRLSVMIGLAVFGFWIARRRRVPSGATTVS